MLKYLVEYVEKMSLEKHSFPSSFFTVYFTKAHRSKKMGLFVYYIV